MNDAGMESKYYAAIDGMKAEASAEAIDFLSKSPSKRFTNGISKDCNGTYTLSIGSSDDMDLVGLSDFCLSLLGRGLCSGYRLSMAEGTSGTEVCAKCGETLTGVDLDCSVDGSESMRVTHGFTFHSVRPSDGRPVVEVDTSWENWTRGKLPESPAGMVHCPHCGDFPFSDERVSLKPKMGILMFPDSLRFGKERG